MFVVCKSYLLYVFLVVLFITSGKRIKIMILLYCIISIYGMITSLGMRLSLFVCIIPIPWI